MATATRARVKPTRPPVLYTGQQGCDFAPEWERLDGDGVPLAAGCYSAPVGDHLPWLVLADWLDERADPRAGWVREFVRWERAATKFKAKGKELIGWDDRQTSFAERTKTDAGWRWVSLYSAIAARWCPDGYGVGPQHETWADDRVKAVNTWNVMWACRLVKPSQAYAAWRQAYAAWSQAYAAGRQAYAAWSQAYAAGRQAYAAWGQADAAWSQADAAGSQAYAAWSQADAAGSQADAAQKRCRKWLMGLWGMMCQHQPTEETDQ